MSSNEKTKSCGCQNRFGIPHFRVGEFTTQFRTILVGIGMLTGGTIWILTHGQMACRSPLLVALNISFWVFLLGKVCRVKFKGEKRSP